MGTHKRLSIALATWNGEKFLFDQLESYLRQSVLPDELVVSDDASQDGTIHVLRDFARHAPFDVLVIENKDRVGYAQNFMRAIRACTGRIVLLSDQDDIWLPQHVEKLAAPFLEARQSPSRLTLTVSRSRHFVALPDGSRREWNPSGGMLRKTWDWRQCHRHGMIVGYVRHWHAPFFGHGMAVARHVVEEYPLPPKCSYHERWIAMVASAIGDFVYLDEVLTLHRVHERNTSGAGHSRSFSVLGPKSFDKNIANLQAFIGALKDGVLSARGRRSLAIARRAIEGYKARARAHRLGWRGILTCCYAFARGYYTYAGAGVYSCARDIIDLFFNRRGPNSENE